VGLSAANIAMTVYLQKRKTSMQVGAYPDPVGRTFLTMSTGAIFSETYAVYGLILTLLSGSMFYGVRFSMVTWASLLWVRGRFKQNLGKLPDNQPNSTS
jgi:F0F1-type ATP synthase membrane subunit c/vacuolar-type H+-ATPase subunit K